MKDDDGGGGKTPAAAGPPENDNDHSKMEEKEVEIIDILDDSEDEVDYGGGLGQDDYDDDDILRDPFAEGMEDGFEVEEDGNSNLLNAHHHYSAGGTDDYSYEGEGLQEDGGAAYDPAVMEEEALDEEAVMTILTEAQSCRWCQHPQASEGWLRAFLFGDGRCDDESFWTAMKNDTYQCLYCLDGYTAAKQDCLEYLRNQAQALGGGGDSSCWATIAGEIEGRLTALDKAFVKQHLKKAKAALDDAASKRENPALPPTFPYGLMELIIEYKVCLADASINAVFTNVMERIGEHIDMEDVLLGRRLPGVYHMLAHESSNVRSWALKTVKKIGQLDLDALQNGLDSVLHEWYKSLEDEYLEPSSTNNSIKREHHWMALSTLFDHMRAQDDALATWLSNEFPLLPEIVVAHAMACCASLEKDNGFSSSWTRTSSKVALDCLKLLLLKMGDHTWAKSQPSSPLQLIDWLVAQLYGRTQQEGIFKALLDTLPPFLCSLRQGADASGSRASLVNDALRHLVATHKQLPVTAPNSTRRFIEGTLCRILRDAYDPAHGSIRTWPLETKREWAPILVRALGPFGTESAKRYEKGARDTIHLLMEQHRREVCEQMEDAARGLLSLDSTLPRSQGGAGEKKKSSDSSTSSSLTSEDLLCGPLMHALTRTYSVTELPPLLRDDLFVLQATLYLAPRPTEMPLPRSPSLRRLVKACDEQTAAFTSFLGRLLTEPSSALQDNPFNSSALAPASLVLAMVVPLLLGGEERLTAHLLHLLCIGTTGKAIATTSPTSWEQVVPHLPSWSLRRLWHGVRKVLRDLVRVDFMNPHCGATQVLPYFLNLILALLKRQKDFPSSSYSPPIAWWCFVLAMLEKGRVGDGGTEGSSKSLPPSVLHKCFEVAQALLPCFSDEQLRQTHGAWLGALTDWANDARLAQKDPSLHHAALAFLIDSLNLLATKDISLSYSVGPRLRDLKSNAANAAMVVPALGRRLAALRSIYVTEETMTVSLRSLDEAEGEDEEVEEEKEEDQLVPETAEKGEPDEISAQEKGLFKKKMKEAIDLTNDDSQEMKEQKPAALKGKNDADLKKKAKVLGNKAAPTSRGSFRPVAPPPKTALSAFLGQSPPLTMKARPRPSEAVAASSQQQQQQHPRLRQQYVLQQARAKLSPVQQSSFSSPLRAAGFGRARLQHMAPRIGAQHSDDDFIIFRQLKDLTKNAPTVARAFHSLVVKWSLSDLASSSSDRESKIRLDSVPLRYRDPTHYLDIWQPLLLEETRCSLARDLKEGLRTAATAAVGDDRYGGGGGGVGGRGQKKKNSGNLGEVLSLELQRAQEDIEGDGLSTVTFLALGGSRLERMIMGHGATGQEVFLLQPKAKTLSQQQGDGRSGGNHHKGSSSNMAHEAATSPHALAVFLPGGEDDGMLKFRVAVTQPLAGAGGLCWKDFKPNSSWKGTMIGSLTTAAREFAALREVLGFRLAPRLIHGGKGKPPGGEGRKSLANLAVVDAAGLLQRWQEVEVLLKVQPRPEAAPAHLQSLRRSIRGLRKIRVSQRLLAETLVGKKVRSIKKTHPAEAIQDACGLVIQNWREQVAIEQACYEGGVSETVVAAGGSQSQSQSMLPQEEGGMVEEQYKENILQQPPQEDLSLKAQTVKCPVQVPLKLWRVLQQQFNAPQLRAIAASCFINAQAISKACEITLLQGPPGTGKTKTILGLLAAIMHSTQRGTLLNGATLTSTNIRPALRLGQGQHQSRILVCAPSNGAVDEITLRLQRDGLLNAEGQTTYPHIVRLGMVDPNAEEAVRKASLDYLLERQLETSFELKEFENANAELVRLKALMDRADVHIQTASAKGQEHRSKGREEGEIDEREWRRQAEETRRVTGAQLARAKTRLYECRKAMDAKKAQLRITIIRDAKIVLSTLSTSASAQLTEAVTSLSNGFGTVVIDEAGQAVEPSTIIPLRYGCRNLILVGDPRQLPATVMSPLVQKYMYERSLFERLEKGGHPVHLLRVQYRMHPEICSFASKEFYEGKLINSPHLTASPDEAYDAVPYFGSFRVFDVSPSTEMKLKTAIKNEKEVEFAIQLFQRFRLEFPSLVGSDKVGIITPYRAQVKLLDERFKQIVGHDYMNLVEISTVDGFQGREKEVIIFSCVRADPRAGIGFLADKRRMNVGLTRARRSLFVLGHRKALATDPTWRALIENAETRNRLVCTRGRHFDDVARQLQRAAGGEEDLPVGPRAPPPKNTEPSSRVRRQRAHDPDSMMGSSSPHPSPPTSNYKQRKQQQESSMATAAVAKGLLNSLLPRCDHAEATRPAAPSAAQLAARPVVEATSTRRPPPTLAATASAQGRETQRSQVSSQDLAAIEKQQRLQQEGWLTTTQKRPQARQSATAPPAPSQRAPERASSAAASAAKRPSSLSSLSSASRPAGSSGGSSSSSFRRPAAPSFHTTSSSSSSKKRPEPVQQLQPLGQSKKKKPARETTDHRDHATAAAAPPPRSSTSSDFVIPRKPGAGPSSAREAAMSSYMAAEHGRKVEGASASSRPAAGAAARPPPPRQQQQQQQNSGKKKEQRPTVSLTSLLKSMPGVG